MMDPNYLKAIMRGEIPLKAKPAAEKKEKGKFDSVIDKEIDAFVDAMELDEDPAHIGLKTPQMRRQEKKQEIKDAVKLPELNQQLFTATALLFTEGARYLSNEKNDILQSDLSAAATRLGDVTVEEVSKENLQTIAQISNESMDSILEIALAKFNEERLDDCLALFSLLTILNPSQTEYWFRLGIVAQKVENYELASRAYAAALELDPAHIGARLFAAQCFIKRNMPEEAKAEVVAAKGLSKQEGIDQMWLDLLAAMEGSIK